ncbi:hypothetical protein M426DRAFT_172268 [Hypoxylon sp. CI-4A]|nr:hypothetical protein M426DRAFT_172268 [Hypoxylon sp. CI-4A]
MLFLLSLLSTVLRPFFLLSKGRVRKERMVCEIIPRGKVRGFAMWACGLALPLVLGAGSQGGATRTEKKKRSPDNPQLR